MPTYEFLQHVGDFGLANGGFSFEGGRYTDVFDIVPFSGDITRDIIQQAIKDILGHVDYDYPSGNFLRRLLPKAHPLFPWMFANSISSIQGIGNYDKNDREGKLNLGLDSGLETQPITYQYWLHPRFRAMIEFTPRMYGLLSDSMIDANKFTIGWANRKGEVREVIVRPEWWRFTDWEYEPRENTRYAQHGMLEYRVKDGVDVANPVPHMFTFNNYPKMIIPAATVRFRWFQVPFGWVASFKSFIIEYVGHVNQHDWLGWKKGSLLYLGAKILRRYTPPVPRFFQIQNGSLVPSLEKLCDVEFVFDYTSRTPEPNSVPTNLGNANYIAAGHNLEFWLRDRNPYYIAPAPVEDDESWFYGFEIDDNMPLYFSFPFELLFQNPDAY